MQSDLIKALGIVSELMRTNSLSEKDVVERISDRSRVSEEDILGRSRRESVVFLRQGAYYIWRKKFDLGYAEIGHLVHRHHTTIMNGVRNIKKGLECYAGELS